MELAKNPTQPLVSIGVPTYNRPHGLLRALECIKNQTYDNLEIIVSDNCTAGKEVDVIMKDAVQNDPRIRYVKQNRNIGAIQNFEFVLKESKGVYFVWAADDDLCNNEFIEKLVECMEQQPNLVLCGCDVQVVDENDTPLEVSTLKTIRPDEDWNRARRMFFRLPVGNEFFCIYGLFRSSFLKQCNIRIMKGWKGYVTCGELLLLAQLSMCGQIAAIPDVLKIYRRHSDSKFHQETAGMSGFDAIAVRFLTRLRLLKIAFINRQNLWVRLGLLKSIFTSWLGECGSFCYHQFFHYYYRIKNQIMALVPAVIKEPFKSCLKYFLEVWHKVVKGKS